MRYNLAPMRTVLVVLGLAVAAASLTGCAHKRLAAGDLDRVQRPAFISRIVEGAGPHSHVFREDGSYGDKLKKLEPREADRRLEVKLGQGSSRFEISERLRAVTLAELGQERPWGDSLDPVQVATALESFLVEEVPANAPDYELLRPLGADAIVEFVVEEYGMRSEDGRAGIFVRGYARMFRLDGGGLWRRPFSVDQVDEGAPHLDPFRVAKDPELYRRAMTELLDGLAKSFVVDLSPPDRRGGPAEAAGANELTGEDDGSHRTGRENEEGERPSDELPAGELPDPDP